MVRAAAPSGRAEATLKALRPNPRASKKRNRSESPDAAALQQQPGAGGGGANAFLNSSGNMAMQNPFFDAAGPSSRSMSAASQQSAGQPSGAAGDPNSESFLLAQLSDSGCEGLIDMFLGAGYDFAAAEQAQQQQAATGGAVAQQLPAQPLAPFPQFNPTPRFGLGVGKPMLGAASLLQQQAQLLQQQQQQSIAGAPLHSPDSGHSRGGGDNDGCSDSEEEYGFSKGDALTEDNLAHRDRTEAPPPANSGGRKGAKAGKHAATSDDGSGAPTARRGQMSMDEKAEASRDRNRKHARNTRLRKKAYIEELERTVQQLTAERDAAAAAKAAEGARAVQLQSVRFSVLQMALFYRAAGNTCRADWATALEEGFTCVLPITPYRSFPSAEVVSGQRMIVGIDAMIADVASLALMVESIGRCRPSERRVQVQYYAGPEDAITSGDMLSCRWMLRTENAMACGALCECHAQGMLRARYSPSHKLAHLELAFDVMGFMQQLQRASGLEDFRVVPNTLAMAQAPCDADARFITTAEPPYLIVHASPAWCRLCGYASEEAVGRTAALLQGPATDRAAVARFMGAVRARHCCSMEVVNYTKAGVPFANYIVAYPLSTDGRVTHYLATISAAAKPPPPAAATVAAVAALAAPAAATALLPQGGLAMSVMPPLGAGATLPQIMPNGGSGGAAAGVAATGFRRRKTEVVTPLPTPAAPPLGWQ